MAPMQRINVRMGIMTIECLKFQSVNKGSFLGYADFYIPKTGLEIFSCQVFQKDGKRWVNMPSREYTNEQGEKKFSSYLRYRDPAHRDMFNELALKAIEKKCAEMQTQSAIQPPAEDVPF
jgi:hypothetical protein